MTGGNLLMVAASVVIDDFDRFRAGVDPAKADSPLIIYAYAVLAGPITLKRFQAIPRRNP